MHWDWPSDTNLPSRVGGQQFRPDGHYLRSVGFCVLGPVRAAPASPDVPSRPNRRAYKLRQQPVGEPRESVDCPGFFFVAAWPDMHFTPFFEFVIVVVVVGSLIVLATAVWSTNSLG
jgi:hypothetical protein